MNNRSLTFYILALTTYSPLFSNPTTPSPHSEESVPVYNKERFEKLQEAYQILNISWYASYAEIDAKFQELRKTKSGNELKLLEEAYGFIQRDLSYLRDKFRNFLGENSHQPSDITYPTVLNYLDACFQSLRSLYRSNEISTLSLLKFIHTFTSLSAMYFTLHYEDKPKAAIIVDLGIKKIETILGEHNFDFKNNRFYKDLLHRQATLKA